MCNRKISIVNIRITACSFNIGVNICLNAAANNDSTKLVKFHRMFVAGLNAKLTYITCFISCLLINSFAWNL